MIYHPLPGEPVALREPLDFLVVADHLEALGLFPLLDEQNAALLATSNGRRWSELFEQDRWSEIGLGPALEVVRGADPFGAAEARIELTRTMWQRVIEKAERPPRGSP